MIDLQREICKPALKLDFTAHSMMESLSEFGPGVVVGQTEINRGGRISNK